MCEWDIISYHHLALEAFGGFGPTPLEAFGVEVQALSTGALEPYKTGLGKLMDLLAIQSLFSQLSPPPRAWRCKPCRQEPWNHTKLDVES